ncbi:MAG: NAD(P)H-dependent oxidoreductase, partial [Polaromonas sp.]
MSPNPHFLFLTTSTRQPPEEGGHLGNTEWLAQQAAAALPAGIPQTWHHLSRMRLPMFVDRRHSSGQYDMPTGDMKTLLDATLAATDIVFVAPVYWYSIPAPLKVYL